MFRVTAEGLVLTLYEGMPLALWIAAWVVTGENSTERRDAFLHLYHLEIVTIDDPDEPFDAVKQREGWEEWWAEMALWLLDPRAACLDGCPQSQRPVM